MKYLMLFLLLICGCSKYESRDESKYITRTSLDPYVDKFKDGDVTCYLYIGVSISCLRDVK